MSTLAADDLRRLEDLRDLSATDLRHRLGGMVLIALTFAGLVGWRLTLAWWVTAVIVHVALGPTLTAITRLKATVATRAAIGFVVLALSHALTGSLAIAATLVSGPWGLVLGNLFLASLVVYAVRAGTRSEIAFRAALIPYSALLMTLPVLALLVGAPWVVALVIGVATVIYLHHFVGAHRANLEALAEKEAARARAEAATEAKSSFVAMVSHELRTPISGILAGSAALERSARDKASRSHAALIGEAARMMRVLLNDLLDLSKIEAGRMTVEEIDFDLRSLVLEATRFWAPETIARGLRFRLRGVRRLPQWVRGDPTRLRQILNNLVSNALKFTAEGSVTLRFAVDPDPAAGGVLLTLEVIDTGPGMGPEQMSRLFEAFEQLGSSTARTHGGTGLGLNISRQLATLMSGALEAESAEGDGATFRLRLPLTPVAPPAAAPEAQPSEAPGLRVLVADDHHVNRRAFTMMLEPLCAELVCVEDGSEALAALAAQPFDVVLMDLNMPVMGGLEAVGRLRGSSGPNQAVPVIALTASAAEHEAEACRAIGMDGFVTKPVEASELFAAIESVLTARDGTRLEPAA